MGEKNIGHFTVLKVEMLMQENRQSRGQRRLFSAMLHWPLKICAKIRTNRQTKHRAHTHLQHVLCCLCRDEPCRQEREASLASSAHCKLPFFTLLIVRPQQK